MQHFYQNIQGWFTFPNFYRSVVEHAQDGQKFVEVGCWKGKSIAFLGVEIINSGKNIVMDAVDTWEGSVEHLDPSSPFYEPLLKHKDGLYNHFLQNIEPLKQVVRPIRMNSFEASQTYKDSSVDFVFIDASHDYENVVKDIQAWLPKIKRSGVLAGHDIIHPPIKQAVADVLGETFYVHRDEDVWVHIQ